MSQEFLDDLYDETSLTGSGIPQWVIESEKELNQYHFQNQVEEQPPEEYMQFTKKYCDADKYAPVQCMLTGPIRDCGHYVCDIHYCSGEFGTGYFDSTGKWEKCIACLGILNSTSYKLARWCRLSMRWRRFRYSVAQIKIARCWRRKALWLAATKYQPNLSKRRQLEIEEKLAREESARLEREKSARIDLMNRERLDWINRLQSQLNSTVKQSADNISLKSIKDNLK